jgi:hypothetical protein
MNELITKQSSRLLFSILTPGFFGVFPYGLILYFNFKEDLCHLDSSLVLFVLFFFSLALGLIFHLFGMKLEIEIDSILQSCHCKEFYERWEEYLSLNTESVQSIRKKYMSFLIDRYHFQLNMCPASIAAIVGLCFLLHQLHWSPWHIIFLALVGFSLVVLLFVQCYHVGKLLHDNRLLMIADAQRNCKRLYKYRSSSRRDH